MAFVATICGVVLIAVVLWEGFETVILPRRATRRFRLTRLFYRHTWLLWARLVTAVIPPRRQEMALSFFGPASMLILLSIWAWIMILGFALLQWAVGSTLMTHDGKTGFLIDLYMSGTTFFTLGLGDVVPRNAPGRFFVVIESGMGLAFLALIVAYLPALNQSFSRRETSISLLDARAGSPPTAAEMFRRHGREPEMESLRQLLHDWEHWSAAFLESHLSYPVLAYFRSQHDNQSWLAALTAILDTSALAIAGVEGACRHQAQLTFAMARHAVVDLSIVFRTPPADQTPDRLPPERLAALRALLAAAGIKLREGQTDQRLAELRRMYEPYVHVLASYFRLRVPPWIAEEDWLDDWQASTWERGDVRRSRTERAGGEHF
ncbi:MAG: potassium channel family protein [Planctomycetes bacterium]|nr:potassium channel family protein [Planctomycetota bacterium]